MDNQSCSCFIDTFSTIIELQRRSQIIDDTLASCDKPFLGPCLSAGCLNTRPITLYTCCSGTLIELPYTLNGTEGTSSVFRVEAAEGCCATFRILAPNPDTSADNPYVATDSFFTANLSCIGSIKCLPDTFISCV